ncbi:MAG: class I SAM-dependent methyltransferase [Actinobacteria bacterium]|nr:class I SAM-dependent methyltransferase [Actinomycetota bacterium]
MTFDVAAAAYDRFMGRYSSLLAPQLAEFAGVHSQDSVLDVGCGPGALTAELVRRLGVPHVTAIEPSKPFAEAAAARFPGVDVRQAPAEEIPFPDGTFDAALAQLVVHFMADPVKGLAEMKRVTRAGGAVAACVWDLAGGRAPLSPFWQAARALSSDVVDESELAGAREGQLRGLFDAAGLGGLAESTLEATVEFASFDEWWEPFTLGVGPAGAYARSLGADGLAAVRAHCAASLPPPFRLHVAAWAVRGIA